MWHRCAVASREPVSEPSTSHPCRIGELVRTEAEAGWCANCGQGSPKEAAARRSPIELKRSNPQLRELRWQASSTPWGKPPPVPYGPPWFAASAVFMAPRADIPLSNPLERPAEVLAVQARRESPSSLRCRIVLAWSHKPERVSRTLPSQARKGRAGVLDDVLDGDPGVLAFNFDLTWVDLLPITCSKSWVPDPNVPLRRFRGRWSLSDEAFFDFLFPFPDRPSVAMRDHPRLVLLAGLAGRSDHDFPSPSSAGSDRCGIWAIYTLPPTRRSELCLAWAWQSRCDEGCGCAPPVAVMAPAVGHRCRRRSGAADLMWVAVPMIPSRSLIYSVAEADPQQSSNWSSLSRT